MVQPYDEVLRIIASYVTTGVIDSEEAYATAKLCLADTLACGFLAAQVPACRDFLSRALFAPTMAGGCRVPGTTLRLDPVQGAFASGVLNRWLDYNDTWLAREWGHPSDNLAAILATADYYSRQRRAQGMPPLSMQAVLTALIKAYEIQGVLALANSFNTQGFDHVLLVKVAAAAVVTHLLGGDNEAILSALSHAWIDGAPLRTYRHAPHTGPRKSWAAGDAASRAVFLAHLAVNGEAGYPRVLTAPQWGVQDVLLGGQELILERPLSSYVMEHILFKVSFPAEFHAQTAVEAALQLYPLLNGRWSEIAAITIETQAAAKRIIDKPGPLFNFADRDHCIQYMVAIALLYGQLTAEHYEDAIAADPRIDALRSIMEVRELPGYSADYLAPSKRSIANTITIFMRDGSSLGPVAVEYPLGHRRRRSDALPLIYTKVKGALLTHLPPTQVESLLLLFQDRSALATMDVDTFIDLLIYTQ